MGSEYVAVKLGGKDRKLRFTWRAIRRLRKEHGVNILATTEEDFTDPDKVAAMLWAALLEADPDIEVDDVDFDLRELPAVVTALGQAMGNEEPGAEPDPFVKSDSAPTPSD
jgi:hypothetical protein